MSDLLQEDPWWDEPEYWEMADPPLHLWCNDCRYVRKVLHEWVPDVQGVEHMTGTVWVDTGRERCTHCYGEDMSNLT